MKLSVRTKYNGKYYDAGVEIPVTETAKEPIVVNETVETKEETKADKPKVSKRK